MNRREALKATLAGLIAAVLPWKVEAAPDPCGVGLRQFKTPPIVKGESHPCQWTFPIGYAFLFVEGDTVVIKQWTGKQWKMIEGSAGYTYDPKQPRSA